MKLTHGIAKVALAALLVAGAGFTAGVSRADDDDDRRGWKHGDRGWDDYDRRGCDDDCNGGRKHKHRRSAYRDACDVFHPRYGHVRFGMYRRGHGWYARPTVMGTFVTRRARVIVVRPVPVWACAPSRSGVAASIRFRDGNTSLALHIADHDPRFGCSLCGESFDSYGRWERHSRACARDDFRGALAFESWDDDDLEYFRAQLELSGFNG